MPRSAGPIDRAERLVFFTDAVVAIALTLLVLPLVELVPEGSHDREDLGALLLDNLGRFGSFALSFLVIFRFWWAHHRLFRHIELINGSVVAWTVVWTLSIVFLPVPTAIITDYDPSPGTVLLYTGTLLVTSASLTMIALTAHRHPELSAGRPHESREEVLGSVVSVGALLVALVLGTLFATTVNYWALLLLLLSGPVETMIKRSWSREGRPA